MTNQHDIAAECEHRADIERFHENDQGDVAYLDITELRADLQRYADHMRRQAERIAALEELVNDATPFVESWRAGADLQYPPSLRVDPDTWLDDARKLVGNREERKA